jgi:hypothetical protein
MKSLRLVLAVASAAFGIVTLAPTSVDACMPGFTHPQKEVILFWHDGVEILLWRARVTPASGGLGEEEDSPPPRTQLAWVLAVPSEPLAYHVVDNEHFDRTTYWANGLQAFSLLEGRGGGAIGGSGGADGLDVGETVRVGEYDVTPIQAEADRAAGALNGWLRRNRFPEANADAVNAYAEEGATFLAVKARVPRGTSAMELRPVGMAFRTDEIVVPVRLSAGEPPFGLSAIVVSTRIPDLAGELTHGLEASALRPHHARGESPIGRVSIVPHTNIPAELRSLVAPITSEVPGFERMLSGTLAVSMLSAQPLSIDVEAADPKIALGAEVAPDAPIGVAHEGHWDELGNFVLGPAPEPAEEEPEASGQEESAAEASGEAASATAAEDDGGLCSAGGRVTGLPWALAALFVLGVWSRRRSVD